MLGIEQEWDQIHVQERIRRVPVRRDHSLVALETEHRALQVEYAALREAHTRLEESDRLRQDLVDMLIHDLKNPLSVVLASLEVISDILGEGTNSDLRELLHIATRSSREMLQLITELLEVKQLESGHFPVQLQPLDVAPLLQMAATQARVLANQKRVHINAQISEELPWIWADLNLTSRLVSNLLENAIRFSPPDETVAIMARPGRKEMRVTVTNSGPSIPARQRERIFEKFYQAGRDPGTGRGSVGLGLAFCKLAVESQRGRIWVESEAGDGVQFHFTLPTWQ